MLFIAFEIHTSAPPVDWAKADTNVVSDLGQLFGWAFRPNVKKGKRKVQGVPQSQNCRYDSFMIYMTEGWGVWIL